MTFSICFKEPGNTIFKEIDLELTEKNENEDDPSPSKNRITYRIIIGTF